MDKEGKARASQKKKWHKTNRAKSNKATQKWREANSKQAADLQKSYRQKDKQRFKLYDRKADLKRKFGLSLEEYDLMLKLQNNCCKLCSKSKLEEKKNLAVDHCHITLKIRGLLCARCNLFMSFVDLPTFEKLLDKARKYKKNE